MGPIVKKLNCLQMRFTVVLLLSASLQISAKGVAQKVSIAEKNAPLEKILNLIEEANQEFEEGRRSHGS